VTPETGKAVARYILAPDLRLEAVRPDVWQVLRALSTVVALVNVVAGRSYVERTSYSPQFGVMLPVACLVVELVSGVATTSWKWLPATGALGPARASASA
jgi:hypothetical protein